MSKKKVKKTKNNNFVTENWKNGAWKQLEKLDATHAVLQFEGGGDDGCVFSCKIYKEKKIISEIPVFHSEKNVFFEELSEPIWEKYGGFNWFDKCSGILTWNCKTKKIEWTGNHEPEGFDL